MKVSLEFPENFVEIILFISLLAENCEKIIIFIKNNKINLLFFSIVEDFTKSLEKN